MLRLTAFQPLKGLINHGKQFSLKFNSVPLLMQGNKKHFSASFASKDTSSILDELDKALESGGESSTSDYRPSYNRSRSREDRNFQNDDLDMDNGYDEPRSFSRGSARRDDDSFGRSYRSHRDSRDSFGERKSFARGDSYAGSNSSMRGGGFRDVSRTREEPEAFKVAEKSDFDYTKYENVPVEIRGYKADNVTPVTTFSNMKLHPALLANIQRRNFVQPVTMQQYTIPLAIEGRDLMMCAQTGSGKTAAFIFPIISKLLHEGKKGRRPQAVIMAPTRELAQQIHAETVEFIRGTDLSAAAVFGGASVLNQISQLRMYPSIIIGTPGRLNDLVDRGAIDLRDVNTLVLDEADRMLDMGFEVQIRQLIENSGMPKKEKRQTMMFSATFPREIQSMAQNYLKDYTYLSFGKIGTATETVEQHFIYSNDPRDKSSKVIAMIVDHMKNGEGGALVFFEQKRLVDEYEWILKTNHDIEVIGLHGDKSQRERNFAIKSLSEGKFKVCLATSVASRGLDLKNISHVINVGLPRDMDDYVHRVGRTGRSGKSGKATTVIGHEDIGSIRRLIDILKQAKKEVPAWLEELGDRRERSFRTSRLPPRYGSSTGSRFGDRDGGRRYENEGRSRYSSDRRPSFSSDEREKRGSIDRLLESL